MNSNCGRFTYDRSGWLFDDKTGTYHLTFGPYSCYIDGSEGSYRIEVIDIEEDYVVDILEEFNTFKDASMQIIESISEYESN